MVAWHEVSRRGTVICIQGNCFLKLSGGRARSLIHFLEQSLRLRLIILIDQLPLVRYNDCIFPVSDCVNWASFSAGKLTSLMTVWTDSLSFQSLVEIKIVSFCHRHLSLTPEMYSQTGQPPEPGCVLGKGLCGTPAWEARVGACLEAEQGGICLPWAGRATIYLVGNAAKPPDHPQTKYHAHPRRWLQCLGTHPPPWVGVMGPWKGEISVSGKGGPPFLFSVGPTNYLARASSRWSSWGVLAKQLKSLQWWLLQPQPGTYLRIMVRLKLSPGPRFPRPARSFLNLPPHSSCSVTHQLPNNHQP